MIQSSNIFVRKCTYSLVKFLLLVFKAHQPLIKKEKGFNLFDVTKEQLPSAPQCKDTYFSQFTSLQIKFGLLFILTSSHTGTDRNMVVTISVTR